MRLIRAAAPFLPYAAIAAGLFGLHSAWAALLGFHATLLAILLVARPAIPFRLLLRSNSPRLLPGCALLCASSGVLLYYSRPLLGLPETFSTDLAALGLTLSAWPKFIAYFALVNPWLEEYFWRGYLNSPAEGLAPVDFFYAGYHVLVFYDRINLRASLIALAGLLFIGWLWRRLSRESSGLLVSSISHMAADLSILTAVYLNCMKGQAYG